MLLKLKCSLDSERVLDDNLPCRQGAARCTRREYKMGALTCSSQASLSLHRWANSRVIGAPGDKRVQPYLM